MSLLSGASAAIRNVVRRSRLTNIESPRRRSEMTCVMYGFRSAVAVSESSSAANRGWVQRTGPRTTMAT